MSGWSRAAPGPHMLRPGRTPVLQTTRRRRLRFVRGQQHKSRNRRDRAPIVTAAARPAHSACGLLPQQQAFRMARHIPGALSPRTASRPGRGKTVTPREMTGISGRQPVPNNSRGFLFDHTCRRANIYRPRATAKQMMYREPFAKRQNYDLIVQYILIFSSIRKCLS